MLMLTIGLSQEAAAQDTEIRHYISIDTKSHGLRHMRLKISGYQVSIDYKYTTAANPTAEWSSRKVTYTSEELIKYTNGKDNFKITFGDSDECYENVMYVKNDPSDEAGKGRKYYFYK